MDGSYFGAYGGFRQNVHYTHGHEIWNKGRKMEQENRFNKKTVRVKPSPIGKGVYACQDFRPGDQIGPVCGRVIDDPQYGSSYCIDLGHERSLEPHTPFRYLNHGCEPNCQLVVYDIENEANEVIDQEVMVEVLRPIQAGDQLLIDYAWPIEAAIPCLCGSPKCRGWVVDQTLLGELQRTKQTQSTKKMVHKTKKKCDGTKDE